jgi:diacylglycerol O-acyltransferase
MERLNSLDQVFLAVEAPGAPWNIGALALLEGPAATLEELMALLDRRLARVPRCRQRVRRPRGPVGRPIWIDDVDFDLARHVGRATVGPGPFALEEAMADFMAEALDHARPLWQVRLLDGLDEGRWALLSKVHHCMVDGIAGTDLLSTLLEERHDDLDATSPWRAAPEPSARTLARLAVATGALTLRSRAASLRRALTHPRASARRVVAVARAARRLWLPVRRQATSLTVAAAGALAWRRTDLPLDVVQRVARDNDATVNDVVVGAVARAMRALLVARGEAVDARVVTALVPVSLRRADERGRLDNRLANVHAELPVGVADPAESLAAVRAQLEELKASHEVDATGIVMHLGDVVPRAVADAVARAIVARQRKVEMVISNVPGPATPLVLGGRTVVAGYPFAPVAGHVAFTVALWSYRDRLFVGVTGREGAEAELERLVSGIVHGLAELGTRAGEGGVSSPSAAGSPRAGG